MKKLLTTLILAIWASVSFAVTPDTVYLVDLRTEVRNLLGGTQISVWWSDDMIDQFLNSACREYSNISTEGIGAEDTIITSDSITDYTLSCNFIEKKGVLRIQGVRKVTLLNRTTDPSSPAEKAIGVDNVSAEDSPQYYTIYQGDTDTNGATFYIRLDPPTTTGVADTILVDYKRQAAYMDSDSVACDVPYAGLEFVVKTALWKCLVAGRDQPGVNVILPMIDRDYKEAKNTVQNRYAPQYDVSWKPSE